MARYVPRTLLIGRAILAELDMAIAEHGTLVRRLARTAATAETAAPGKK